MASPPDDDKRHVYGPRAVAALLPSVLRPAFKRRSPASARILSDWEAMVGPAMAAVTIPRRLSAGVLTIGCSGPVALELQHLSDQVAARINAYLGSTAVARIRLVQEFHATLSPTPPAFDAAAEARATQAVASLPTGPLRDSLLRLGTRILVRRA